MSGNILNKKFIICLLTQVGGFGMNVANAETVPSAGQLVPSTFEAKSTTTKTGYYFGNDLKTLAPPGAEKSVLLIGNVVVEGLDPRFQSQFDKRVQSFNGQRRPVSEIYDLAGSIQQMYADDGFFLNRVIIPPQHVVHGGTITLKVAEGFISEIDYASLSPQVRDRVASYFIPMMGKLGLKGDEFQRALLLAARTNGLKLKTNLKPAKEALGVALTLSGEHDPVSGQVSLDNSSSKSLGTYQATMSAALNSPFQRGEQFYFSVGGAPFNGFISDKSPRRTFAAGVTAPLADNGLTANLEYTWSGAKQFAQSTGFATASQFKRFTAKLAYPVILSQSGTLTARLAFDDVDEVNTATAFKTDIYHDHLNVIRAGLDYATSLGGVDISGNLDASQGISGLWSRGQAEALHGTPLSQKDASDRFTKFHAGFRLYQEYASGLSWDVSGRGQYAATGPLLNSEKFVLGCACDLSGADAGSWNGDSGWAVRGELQFNLSPHLETKNLYLKPYLFAARGQVYANSPTAGELAVDGGTGFGLGLRGQWSPSQYPNNPIDFALEAARNISDHPETTPSQWRFNISAKARF